MSMELFPFRYRDPLTGKWVRARYVAERHVIAERHAEFEIIGPPEIRDVDPDAYHFNPAGGKGLIDLAAVGNVGAVITIALSGEPQGFLVAGVAGGRDVRMNANYTIYRRDAQPHSQLTA